MKPKTVEEYIDSFPKEIQDKLSELRACLQEAAPEAKEDLKWGSPAFSYDRILFTYAGFKNHISLYPTPAVIEHFKDDLSDLVTSSSTIQFQLDKPLPLSLIGKIAAFRVKELKDKDARWM